MCKNLIYLIPIILVLSIASITSADLVAHWQFDDGSGTVAVDSTGNGHDGTLLLDPLWVAGKYDGALEFAGIAGQRVEIEGYDGILGTQNRTVMAWVKTTELGDWISWGQNVNTQKWIGRFNDNEGNGQVGALRTECSGGYIISSTVLNDGEWHHVTSVLESDGSPTIEDIKMYVDGGLEAISGFRPVDVNTVGGRNVWIGDGHHDRPLMSVIDDVRIYDNAMTKLEVVAAKENIERVDMEIGFAMLPPVIDGEVDDIWVVTSTQNFVFLDDPANGSGTWKVLYDAENLYVLVDMTDDVLQNDSSSSWQDDSVEVYFDGGNTKLDTPLSGDDHQYTFGWTTDEIQGTNADGYTEGIEHAQVDTDTGWRIEIKMPWLSIQDTVSQAGDLVGIDCYYNDDDDGGDSRENKMLSFSTVEGWNDASQWATAVLANMPEPVDPGTDGLVAFYTLDGDANDSSGNEHNGTAVGDPAFVEGQVGMALDLDGTDDVVELGNIDVAGGITLAAWIKPDDFEINDARIITKANEWGGDDHWWMLSTISETSLRFRLKTDEGPTTATLVSDPVLEAGVFTHVAATWDGSTMRIYKNGIEIASQEKGGSAVAVDPDISVAIGSQPSDAFASDPSHVVKFFDGLIDEVQIYERALSQSELLYLAGFREADTLSGLADVTVVDGAIVSVRDGETEYVVADGDLILGTTTRWYVFEGVETLWAEGDPAPAATVSGTSTPKEGDVGSKADNFLFALDGGTNISSIDGIDFQETIFPSLVDTIIVFERGGNDKGMWQAIHADGSLGAAVEFEKAGDGGPYTDTGVSANGQNAYGVVFKTGEPVQGVRITASGHDTLSISAPLTK